MGKFNKDDSDDIQSMEEACLDDENLCIPLMMKNAMTDVLTTREEIEKKHMSATLITQLVTLIQIPHLWKNTSSWIR